MPGSNKPKPPARGSRVDSGGSSNEAKMPSRKRDGTRETVESILVAFILAFLFRTFEAEAFVIPTGSMAPTLLGRHKDIDCPRCGFEYTIGASDEVHDDSGRLLPHNRVRTAVCPNCRYEAPVEDLPAFKGDRILVNKYPFEFRDPERWEVVVFKYPEQPAKNYIKRLVGLPGETIQIRQGDVYAEKDGVWNILRKDDPNKQRDLQIVVHDNDHPARELLEAGWPERWAAARRDPSSPIGWSDDSDGWTADPEARTFHLEADRTRDGTYRHLRYRHFAPRPEDWQAVTQGRRPEAARAQLITDFCGYNAYTGGEMGSTVDYGTYWVGDLTVGFEVEVREIGEGAELLVELNEGARQYRCRLDLSDGAATLFYPDSLDRDDEEGIVLARGATAIDGKGRYKISFANVDDRLSLWINDRLVEFDGETAYDPHGGLQYQRPTSADLAPAGVAARNCGVTVSNLLLQRDIYYQAEMIPNDLSGGRGVHEYGGPRRPEPDGIPVRLNRLVDDPEAWFDEYSQYAQPAIFEPLNSDEYFMLGDNSPRSRDSRIWPASPFTEHRHAVPRSLLVGKAFFVYWPHGVPFLNDGKGIPVTYHRTVDGERSDYPGFRVPFYPNVSRMERIR